MLYNPFNFQSNDNWDTDGLYWYNEFYTKKLVWTGLNQFHGPQKTGPRWSSLVPAISGSLLDQLQSMVACFGGKNPDWTRLANTSHVVLPFFWSTSISLTKEWLHVSSHVCCVMPSAVPKIQLVLFHPPANSWCNLKGNPKVGNTLWYFVANLIYQPDTGKGNHNYLIL